MLKIKEKTIFTTLIVIMLIFTVSCSNQSNKIEVYSFSGENDYITVNNGMIIVTGDTEKLIGGDLLFKAEKPTDVKDYNEKFFFYEGKEENIILNNSSTTEGTTEGQNLPVELGLISSEDLFHGNNLDLIKKSLNFSLSGKFINGKKFEYNLVLDVKQAY